MWVLEQGLQESREQLAELRVQGVLQTEGRAVERERPGREVGEERGKTTTGTPLRLMTYARCILGSPSGLSVVNSRFSPEGIPVLSQPPPSRAGIHGENPARSCVSSGHPGLWEHLGCLKPSSRARSPWLLQAGGQCGQGYRSWRSRQKRRLWISFVPCTVEGF